MQPEARFRLFSFSDSNGGEKETSTDSSVWTHSRSHRIANVAISTDTLNKYPRDTTLIIASDLIYFEVLYPPLIRTLLDLTNTNGGGEKRIVMSYKVRSLVKEMPFWQAFGESASSTRLDVRLTRLWVQESSSCFIRYFLVGSHPSTRLPAKLRNRKAIETRTGQY